MTDAVIVKPGDAPVDLLSVETSSTTTSTSGAGKAAVLDFAFGSIAGIVGKTIEFPFDTVKVRLQTSAPGAYAGTLDCLVQTIRNEGFRGLYKGLSSPLVGSMAENAILFSAYNGIQNGFRRWEGTYDPARAADPAPLSTFKIAFAAAGAGAAVSLVLTPVELIKCKLQVQDMAGQAGASNPLRYKGPIDVLVRTLRSEGLRGMYRGQLGTLIREAGGGVVWFGVYEIVVAALIKRNGVATKDNLSPMQIAGAGALAGMAFNGSMFPVDTIKSKMQTDDVVGSGTRQGFLQVARQTMRVEGIRGFYKGLGITVGI